jgi:hypothetical protein
MTRAFLDANVPIYATGRPHQLKEPAGKVVNLVAEHPEAYFTDAEVLQELLHRYRSLRMWPEPGKPIFERFAFLMRGRVEPVYGHDVERAADRATRHPLLSARDLVHLAVMERLGVTSIVTADRAFDGVPGISRLDPARVASWRRRLARPH